MSAKIIQVVCAIIEQEGMILCAQRSSSMSLPLKWEFPGGKLEPNEHPEAALIREIQEELGVNVRVMNPLPANEHSYIAGTIIRLIPYRCCIDNKNTPQPKEHAELKWVSAEDLTALDWAAADVPIVNHYLSTR